MAKPPPPTSTSDPALPTTTSAPKSSSRPAAAGLLAPLAASARTLLASARRSPVTTLAAAFFLLALVMYGEDARTIAELSIDDYLYPDADLYNVSGLPPLALPPPTCDLSRGRWVFDNVSVPAYREKDCTFLTKQVTCLANGRPDDMWQYWRWQPNDCSLPTFDARRFMEAMRGKRLMFVGDSLNRNQWESLVCLVQPILSKGRKKIVKRGSFNTFYAKEYRATLEFYWAPFLVESNSDNPNFHSIKERIISPERIESHAKNWKDVDYLIFNTYIWWMNNADIKVRRPNSKSWSENDEVPRIEAYGQVFKTWSDWLNDNIDPARTSVFFMTISSPHLRMPRRGKARKQSYGRMTESPYVLKPLPSGVPIPMCFCGDPCKVEISEDEATYKQRYWMCSNFAWEPTERQRRSTFITPPPLCDFEQWIDTEIKEADMRLLQGLKEWDAERLEILEKRRREEAAAKEHKEEEEMRRVAACREERERKLERVRRAKAAMEENPDAQNKGKWPRCTQ